MHQNAKFWVSASITIIVTRFCFAAT